MDERLTRRIFDSLGELKRNKTSRSLGVVTAISPDLIVTIDGIPGHTGLKRLDSYTPAEGDLVYIIRTGGDLLILGSIV